MTSLRVAVVTDCVEHVVPVTRDTWHVTQCGVCSDSWPSWRVAWLLSPQQTTPAPGQKCAAEYLGQHQPALQHLQHCSTAAVDTCCSAYQMSTIFSGMEAVVASSGQHKGGDCSTAALQHCSTAGWPSHRARPRSSPHSFPSVGQKTAAAASSFAAHCVDPAALQLRLSTKFREMFTIFLEGVLSCPVHTKNLLA